MKNNGSATFMFEWHLCGDCGHLCYVFLHLEVFKDKLAFLPNPNN